MGVHNSKEIVDPIKEEISRVEQKLDDVERSLTGVFKAVIVLAMMMAIMVIVKVFDL